MVVNQIRQTLQYNHKDQVLTGRLAKKQTRQSDRKIQIYPAHKDQVLTGRLAKKQTRQSDRENPDLPNSQGPGTDWQTDQGTDQTIGQRKSRSTQLTKWWYLYTV